MHDDAARRPSYVSSVGNQIKQGGEIVLKCHERLIQEECRKTSPVSFAERINSVIEGKQMI